MTAATGQAPPRPAYKLAALAFLIVFVGYLATLAPSVTFWDDGEFVATAHILGVPHPPGTPLFIIIGHTWDWLIKGLPTAFKLNMMAAFFSAGSAALFFLFMYEALRAGSEGMEERAAKIFRVGGAFAVVLVTYFAFTVWQLSTDSGKVYPIALILIATSVWLTWLWRRERGGPEGAHLQLVVVYVLGLALANHLIGLLGGPALFAFMFHVLRTEPMRDKQEREAQWAQFGVMVAIWVLLVGLSIGSTGKPVAILGALLWVGALIWSFTKRTWLFAVVALVVAGLGLSTYYFLYLRAGLHPFINEADGATWRNLWAIIGREQYPPRSPFDNPMFQSGATNPHRFFQPFDPTSPDGGSYFTLKIIGLQFLNWIQYFDWQWASSLQRHFTLLAPARLPFTIVFAILGIIGAQEHRKWDKSSFWLIATLFATTSLGLVIYLNFKPGFSIGLDSFPDRDVHEVRERDYFFTISFLTWGLWAGLGIAGLYRKLRDRLAESNDGTRAAMGASPVLLLAMVPVLLNFNAANRKYGVSAMLAHDFAYDMLIGVPPYGILFTNGDNDTFPLWYIQEVEGVRQDVMIVNLSLANTDWYIRQLRDLPARPYQPDANALRLFGPASGPPPSCSNQELDSLNAWADRAKRHRPDPALGRPMCLVMWTDETIDEMQPQLINGDLSFSAGNIHHTYRNGTPMYVKDILILALIQRNIGKRPIVFALTAGTGNRQGLDRFVVEEGLGFKLMPDTVRLGGNIAGVQSFQSAIDLDRTKLLLDSVYKFARIKQPDSLQLEPTDEQIAYNLAVVYLAEGLGYVQQNRFAEAVKPMREADHLAPELKLGDYIRQITAAASTSITTPATPDTSKAHRPAPRDTAKRRGR